jgi:hypothetical protein
MRLGEGKETSPSDSERGRLGKETSPSDSERGRLGKRTIDFVDWNNEP